VTYLLDANVLVALAVGTHVHHALANAWFDRRGRLAFATCPLTQLAFVRLLLNPKITASRLRSADVLHMLQEITALPNHSFWPADLGATEAWAGSPPPAGHGQVTDQYLIALAKRRGGKLATFDRAMAALPHAKGVVELITSH
jgi:hypothetical protein